MKNKSYLIKIGNDTIGETKFEYADPPMGVVFGKIIDSENRIDYEFLKSCCKENGIEPVNDFPEDKFIATSTIEELKVFSPQGVEIEGVGNQISGMDGEGFDIEVVGISYPFYEEEFPHHEKGYHRTTKEFQ